ncbi:MAG: HEPN domain-containing protein [Candidatus Pacearchaeota archaeon]|nr:HEPN domain-containing protein [Candidatus Pacearchaeota archaeon]
MKIDELINDRKKLEEAYRFFINKKLLFKRDANLTSAHIAKSNSNLEFVDFLIKNNKFLDWAVIGLYYSVYHASLALLSKNGFASKNHNATLCFIMRHFSQISKEDVELINKLAVTKEYISFYSGLKEERSKASYSTSLFFNKKIVEELREKSIKLINKIKLIVEQ